MNFLLELLFILLTAASYLIARKIYTKYKKPFLHTILISVSLIIIFLTVFKIDYSTYYINTKIIRTILDISVVAFGYLLYVNIDFLKKHSIRILSANLLGSAMGICSVIILSKLIGLNTQITSTLIPKSITTPLAVEISNRLGGLSSLTAIVVVLSGLFGAVIAPIVFKTFNINSPFAKGIALGTSSHGLGTAKALEYGALEGAIGGLSIGLMGLFTSLIASLLA